MCGKLQESLRRTVREWLSEISFFLKKALKIQLVFPDTKVASMRVSLSLRRIEMYELANRRVGLNRREEVRVMPGPDLVRPDGPWSFTYEIPSRKTHMPSFEYSGCH